MTEKCKIFQDTVHGYISVPSKYCDQIIDTLHFQRLRRIEQTSMRSVFPCARHDRFVHSIGTFHIGDKIFNNIKKNSEKELKSKIKIADWSKIGASYRLACLLHDCGHAPFSHTFEKYYDKQPGSTLIKKLQDAANDKNFSSDIECSADAKEHEKVSALILIREFSGKISDLGGDPILSARMIIGCKYIDADTKFKQLANCFIALLNGNIIDADRLDYIKRDKWASGYNSTNLDLERLLSSICIKIKKNTNEDKYVVCFLKNAISEIPNITESRDFQSSWIFSHHKIAYDQYILEKAVEKLAELLNPNVSKEIAMSKLFNIDSFFAPYSVCADCSIYLPSDDDIVHLLKCHLDQNPYAQEWFSRKHSLKPVWKSYAEFNSFFRERIRPVHLLQNGSLDKNIDKILDKFFEEYPCDNQSHYIKRLESKISGIDYNDVYIYIHEEIKSYDTLIDRVKMKQINFFFYLFIPEKQMEHKNKLVEDMIKKSQ